MRNIVNFSVIVLISLILAFPPVSIAKDVKIKLKSTPTSKKSIRIKPDTINRIPCRDDGRYSEVKTNNINVNFSSYEVIPKAIEIKKRVLSLIPDAEMDQFSASESSANIRFVVPLGYEEKLSDLFIDDPDLTQYNKSSCNYASSYSDALSSYKTYKVLLDNIDDIVKMLKTKTKCSIDEYKIKQMLESQVRSYESSMREYDKQMNRLMMQIYISKKNPKENQ